jgi:hypothetical protein
MQVLVEAKYDKKVNLISNRIIQQLPLHTPGRLHAKGGNI